MAKKPKKSKSSTPLSVRIDITKRTMRKHGYTEEQITEFVNRAFYEQDNN